MAGFGAVVVASAAQNRSTAVVLLATAGCLCSEAKTLCQEAARLLQFSRDLRQNQAA